MRRHPPGVFQRGGCRGLWSLVVWQLSCHTIRSNWLRLALSTFRPLLSVTSLKTGSETWYRTHSLTHWATASCNTTLKTLLSQSELKQQFEISLSAVHHWDSVNLCPCYSVSTLTDIHSFSLMWSLRQERDQTTHTSPTSPLSHAFQNSQRKSGFEPMTSNLQYSPPTQWDTSSSSSFSWAWKQPLHSLLWVCVHFRAVVNTVSTILVI